MTMDHQAATRLQKAPKSGAGQPRVDKRQPIIIQNIELLTPSQILFKRKSLSTANLFLSVPALSRHGRREADASIRPQTSHANHFSSKSSSSTTHQTLDFGPSSESLGSSDKTRLIANGANVKFRKHVTFLDAQTDPQTEGPISDRSLNRGHADVSKCHVWGTFHGPKTVRDETNETTSSSKYFSSHDNDHPLNAHDTNELSDLSQQISISNTGDKSLSNILCKPNFSDKSFKPKCANVISRDTEREHSGSFQQKSLWVSDKQKFNTDIWHKEREVTLEGVKPLTLVFHQELSTQNNLNSDSNKTVWSENDNNVNDKGSDSEQWFEREKSELLALLRSRETPETQSHVVFRRSQSTEPPSSHWESSAVGHLNPTTAAIRSKPDSPSCLASPRKVIKVNFLKDDSQRHQKMELNRVQDKVVPSDGDHSSLVGGHDNGVNAIFHTSDAITGYIANPSNKADSMHAPLMSSPKKILKIPDSLEERDQEGVEKLKSLREHNADFLMQQYSTSGEKQFKPKLKANSEENNTRLVSDSDSLGKSVGKENDVSKSQSSRVFPLNSPRACDKERRLLSALPVRSRSGGARAASAARNVKREEPTDKLSSAERLLLSLDKRTAERTWMNRRLEQLVINSTKFGSVRMIHDRSSTTLS